MLQQLNLDNVVESKLIVYEDEHDSLKDEELILGIPYTVERISDGTVTTMNYRLDPDPNKRYIGKVIIDYDYFPGGTYSYQGTEQQYQVGLSLSKYISIFGGLNKAENSLIDGKTQFALQNTNSTNYGLRFDFPLTRFFTLGGDSRTEEERSGITPNLRISNNAYIRLKLLTSTFVQLSTQTTTVDYFDNEVLRDVDLVRYNLRLRSRPSRRTLMSLSAVAERDLATPIPRETFNM